MGKGIILVTDSCLLMPMLKTVLYLDGRLVVGGMTIIVNLQIRWNIITRTSANFVRFSSLYCWTCIHIFIIFPFFLGGGASWPWSYGSWIYNYLCNQCLSPLMLWVGISIRARCTLCDQVCQWLATGLWFSPGTPVSSINKTDNHDIAEILLKVALNTTTLTLSPIIILVVWESFCLFVSGDYHC
jgi:hypothetical protein